MDAEGKRIWPALCKAGATEEDRAEAADQRAQADEEKAEAERNIAEADQLKEGASIRAALGFPKDALWPSEAATLVNNAVIQHQNAQTMSDEEEEEEKRALRAAIGFPKEGWRRQRYHPDYEPDPLACSDQEDIWYDINSDSIDYSWRLFKNFIRGVKQMGWSTSADYDDLTGLEEESEGWIHAVGMVWFEGKGGQKIRLPRGKSIVLDRRVNSEVWLWAAHESEDVEVELGTGVYDCDCCNDPREEIMGYAQVECPDPKGVSAIGFSYEGDDEPLKWFPPSQTDKMLELFALTFPKELGIRSKVKKRGEGMLSKEGQTIRDALGFPKEAGRVNLGRVVQTRGVNSKSRENRAFGREVMDAFRKYQRGNWGDTERDSVKRNNAVVKDGAEDQIFAVYNTSEGKIYIITEWDGSVTTILFSHEY